MKKMIRLMALAAALLPFAARADGTPLKIKETQPGQLVRATFPASRAFALADKQVPGGMIVDAELEDEKGRLIYSFDVKVPGAPGIEEVNIDAVTGNLIGLDHEDEASDKRAAEARASNQKQKAIESVPGLRAAASYPLDKAIAKIESLVPKGTILSVTLEKEGKTILYAFDVAVENKSGIEDIDISAKSGMLLHWEHLSPAEFSREKKADEKRAGAQRSRAAK